MQPLDLFRKQMVALNPIQPVIDQIARTLESGHRVWLVGGLSLPAKGQTPPETPPAPNAPWGWAHGGYVQAWGIQTGFFIQNHALQAEVLPPVFNGAVNPYENLRLVRVSGWRA